MALFGTLSSLGVIDYVSFGSENGDLDNLNTLSSVLINEPKEYKHILSNKLSTGISFPLAQEKAICEYLGQDLTNVLSTPNNILGIGYLKALQKLNSEIEPYTVKRHLVSYNSRSRY